jgi:hypothetical protein
MTAARYWTVVQGTSTARVRADDHAGAVARAAQLGFKTPDSIVLAYDLTLPAQVTDESVAEWRDKVNRANLSHSSPWQFLSQAEQIFWRQQCMKRVAKT